jgi:prolyl-tRNA synthetase
MALDRSGIKLLAARAADLHMEDQLDWAINVTRAENFSQWYQAVVKAADLAELSPVRGCMVIRPWAYGVWELIQQGLDNRFKETGHENCYFPLFIPLSFLAKEAQHVQGFAPEVAIVTHHRLKTVNGELVLDPEAELAEPLIVRPTSETIVGDAFKRWIQSYRDLPVLLNQWANVVRWEMRTRLFLRTTEFLWQEGHTAHAEPEEAFAETLRMLDVYRRFAEEDMALPVVPGEKPENERFPGAQNTFSIEAMMQDGKALQSGTSHYLGTNFAAAQGITYQAKDGEVKHVHTTSWGASTRLVGALIMAHGDDDGLRLPPVLAPRQIVIIPLLKGGADDGRVMEYANSLAARLRSAHAFERPIRVAVDAKEIRAGEKRWNWVRKGAPIIAEIGGREVDRDNVTFVRRDNLRDGNRVRTQVLSTDAFCGSVGAMLAEIQARLLDEARSRRDALIQDGPATLDDLEAYFGPGEDDGDESEATSSVRGWVRASWAQPTNGELDAIVEQLKARKLTIRNAPLNQPLQHRRCIFTGRPGRQEILIGRAY